METTSGGNGSKPTGPTDFDALMLIPFQFNGTEVTAIIDEFGEPWFVAKEVCALLGIGNTAQALSYLEEYEHTIITDDSLTSSRNPNVSIINESGLYSLILKSRKPEAKAFKKWVTSELLPTIRRTGGYALDETKQFERALKDPAKMLDLIKHYAETNLALSQENKAMLPKVQALDLLIARRALST
jgi:anti-repressor protein